MADLRHADTVHRTLVASRLKSALSWSAAAARARALVAREGVLVIAERDSLKVVEELFQLGGGLRESDGQATLPERRAAAGRGRGGVAAPSSILSS